MMFIDTNIFLRFITRDTPTKAKKCLILFQDLQEGKIIGYTSATHIAEIVYVLTSKKLSYQLTHKVVTERLIPLIEISALNIGNKKTILRL